MINIERKDISTVMDKAHDGVWRKGSDEQYKVFVSGSEKASGDIVEVKARYGKTAYTIITDTHSKIKGGFLYDFRYTRKPVYQANNTTAMNLPIINFSSITKTDSMEVSLEELDAALGLD